MAKEFHYTIGDLDRVIEEKGNKFTALRRIKWGEPQDDKKFSLDIRHYSMGDDGEKMLKGFSFSTEEGPHELVKVMAEEGFGYTDEILGAIKDREDFMPSLCKVLNPEQIEEAKIDPSKYDKDDYYDPKSLLE